MAVTNITNVQTYSGNGSTTDFTFSFKIDDIADVKLFIDNVEKTYITDYTVVKATGILTTAVAPINNSVVKIQRATPLTRTIDYIEGGNLQSQTLDTDLDKMMLLLQDQDGLTLTRNVGSDDFNANTNKIINVVDPINLQDAATKGYVDASTLLITTHSSNTLNPHSVTATQIGLGSVDDTADLSKPISANTQVALDLKLNATQVLTPVPAGALFTDTTYSKASIDIMGINAATLNNLASTAFALIGHDHSGTYANSIHTHTEYEPAFIKNSGFNQAYGSGPNTVTAGDDSRLSDSRTPLSHTHSKTDITDLIGVGIANYVQETTPVSASQGDLWFGTTTQELKVYDGTSFKTQNLNEGYF